MRRIDLAIWGFLFGIIGSACNPHLSEKELQDGYRDSLRRVCLWNARCHPDSEQNVERCIDFYLAAPTIIKLPQNQIKACSKYLEIFSAIDMRCRLEMYQKYGKKYCEMTHDFVQEHSQCEERLGIKYYRKEQITCLRKHRGELKSLLRK